VPLSKPILAGVLVVVVLAPACIGAKGEPVSSRSTSPDDPIELKVAYFSDSELDEPYQHELPALQGLRLAFTRAAQANTSPATIDLVELDTHGDAVSALALARQVASDPAYVAAVAAPFWEAPDEVRQLLDDAGLVVVDLSESGELASTWTGRLRMVPPLDAQVEAMAAYLRKHAGPGSVCVAHDGKAYGISLASDLSAALGRWKAKGSFVVADEPSAGVVVGELRHAGCAVVAWTGFGTMAAALRVALTDAGMASVPMVGSDAMKTDGFLEDAMAAGEGTVVFCGCVDLTTSTELSAQVFIHDYQSEYGSAPGLFASEGLDAGNLLLAALRSTAPTRDGLRSALASIRSFEGLARSYAFDDAGEIVNPRIRRFVDRGQRWVPATAHGAA
jgi:branched-chain amino acid transport system substrate-binding protein